MKKHPFTLLELMVAFALLLLASGAVSWNIYQAVKKYQFRSDISRLQRQLASCYTLALNTASDWKFSLSYKQNRLRAQAICPLRSEACGKPLFFDSLKVQFNGEEIEELAIYFSPTGRIEPMGRLEFHRASTFHEEIFLPDLFRIKEIPDKEGPMHPNDVASS